MRLLHTADLHIGRMFGEINMMKDQARMLDTLAKMAADNKVQAVLLSGDVYQRQAPQADAMELFDSFVSQISDAGIKLIMISGNHDSAQRISYFSRLIRKSGVYASGSFDGTLQTVTLSDEYGELDIKLLPYTRPSTVRLKYPNEKIESYTDAVKCVIERSNVDYSKRNVLMAHQFITGGEYSQSEEKLVGTLEDVNASVFEGFDYVALGHLHRPQKIGKETVRYSGSPLKYSFSEAGDVKSAVLVEIRKKGDIDIKTLPIPQPNDVRLIEGKIADIMAMPYSEDYVHVTVTDEEVPPDTRRMMSTVFKNLSRFVVNNSKTKQELEVRGAELVEDLDAESLFRDFYAYQNNGVLPGEAQLKIFKKLFDGEAKRA